MAAKTSLTLAEFRHPDWIFDATEWAEWRDTFAGGEHYLQRYLHKFSERETAEEFCARKSFTPIPTFAKAAILDIRNSIFQRLEGITRVGGSVSYQKATMGEGLGVDREGSSMNSFIGIDVLTELLVMGRVGIYVDAPNKLTTTLAEVSPTPYLYHYRIEDVLNFKMEDPEQPGQFKAIVLRDHVLDFSTVEGAEVMELPIGRRTRRRMVWKDDEGVVRCKLWDEETGDIIPLDGADEDGSVALGIPIVPFIMPTIGDSLLKDVTSYQKALLNLASADVNYALKSNTPFLTIQSELRTAGAHLKDTGENATPGGQRAATTQEQIGGAGRYYDRGMDRPGYIAPPTDPLKTSMQLQEKLEDDIRKLINLAVANKVGSRTESAESKKLSSQGLEAGLSYIGMVLQEVERHIAEMWAMYENVRNPNIARVSYPSRYILKDDSDRIQEATALLDLMDRIPGKRVKKQMAKQIVTVLLGGKINTDLLLSIHADIDSAGYTSSDIQTILDAQKAGLVGDQTASEALGFKEGEVAKAKKDRAERAVAILAAQTSPDSGIVNPASRGVPELDTDPNSGSKERESDDGDE